MPKDDIVMSINNQRRLNKLFAEKREAIEKEVYPFSDPSILKGRVNEQLEILDQILSDLKTQINDEMKKCNDLKGKPYSILKGTIDDVTKSINEHFNDFSQKTIEIGGSIVYAVEAFEESYSDEISKWKNDFTSNIEKINKDIGDAKFKFNRKELSLNEIVDSYFYNLCCGSPYLVEKQNIINAITELKKQCSKTYER